ncbi:putative reverse transcriptase domain-containing protein [Tanacetum coccineum]
MIPTTIPSTAPTVDLPVIHDDTPLILTDTPTISPIVPTIPPIAPTIQYTSLFICTDSSDSDTSNRPPSHDPYEAIVDRWRSRVAACSSPPIPDYSSSDHFTSDDSSRDSPSDSSSETSSDSHSDTSSDSSSRHSSSGHPLSDSLCDSLTSTSVGPSHKRCRYSDSEIDFEVSSEEGYVPYVPREIGLGVEVEDRYEPYTEPDIDFDVQTDIDACIAFADKIATRETDVRVEVGTAAEEEAESSARGTIEIGVDRVTHLVVSDDTVEPVGEDSPELVSADGSLEGHRIVATSQQSAAMSERIETMPTATRFEITQDVINELIAKRKEESLQVYDAAKNLVTEIEIENEQQDDNVEVNCNNGNVKYASCTLLDGALTWWNSHKRTVGVDAAYAMTWKALMKLMTEMVLKEEDQVEKYIGSLRDNIHGNVIDAEPFRLHDAIRITNNLMDQKLKGYTIKNVEYKRRLENSSRDNLGQQQQPFKRQNINGQNMARAYTVGNNIERRGYVGALPCYNKCRMHHEGPCTVKCGNCKKCGRQGHYRSECPKLRNQNRGNKTENKTGNNKAKARAYATRGGGVGPNSNVVTCAFLLNNHYASMIFDSCADKSFVSTTFSTLLDVIPSTLDTSYVVELVDGRISETNVILRG